MNENEVAARVKPERNLKWVWEFAGWVPRGTLRWILAMVLVVSSVTLHMQGNSSDFIDGLAAVAVTFYFTSKNGHPKQ